MSLVARWQSTALLVMAALAGCAFPAAAQETPKPSSYLADMRAALTAAKAGDMTRVRKLLDRHRPRRGEADPRAWEWYHLQALCREPSFSLRGHSTGIAAVAWTPDGKRLASGSKDGTVKVWDVTAEKEALKLRGPLTAPIYALAWSPDGKQLAAVTERVQIKVWDATKGTAAFAVQIPQRFLAGQRFSLALSWSPDGQRLVVDAGDGMVRVYQADSGKEVLLLKGDARPDAAVAWSPDGKRLAAAGDAKTVKVWDLSQDPAKESLTLTGPTGKVLAVAWSPDGKRLAAAGTNQPVRVWDTATGKEVFTQPNPSSWQSAGRLAWSPDGKQLMLDGVSFFKAWDVAKGSEVRAFDSFAGSLLSPDGRRVLDFTVPFPGQTGRVTLRDTATGRPLRRMRGFEGPGGGLNRAALAWSPDGRRVAAGSHAGTLKVWSLTGVTERWLPLPGSGIPAWSADGRQLFFVDQGLAVSSWDVVSGEQRSLLEGATRAKVVKAARDPDGHRLAASYPDGVVRLWPMDATAPPVVLRGHTKEANTLAWSPDGKRLASATADSAVKVWDAAKGEQVLSFAVKERLVGFNGLRLVWAPDNRRLATVAQNSFGARVRVRDIVTGKETLALDPGMQAIVKALVWSPDGKWLAAQSHFWALKVWDAKTGREVLDLKVPGGGTSAFSLAWTPDGGRLAFIQQGQGFKVVEVATKKELLALGNVGQPRALAWSPDGKRLAVASPQFTQGRREIAVKVWDAATGKVASSLDPGGDRINEIAWLSWSPDGKYIASASSIGDVAVWDVTTRKPIAFRSGWSGQVFWDRAGPRLASVIYDRDAQTWTATVGSKSRVVGGAWWGKWKGGTPSLGGIAWSKDRRQLAIAVGGTLEVRRLPTGAKVFTLNGQSGLTTLAWSPDDRRLAAAGFNGSVAVWDIATGQSVLRVARDGKPLPRPMGTFAGAWSPPLAWSPDGKRVAAAGEGRRVRVWEVATGEELTSLRGHEGDVFALAWSPDGKRLATGSADRTLKVWEAATGKNLLTLDGHKGPVFWLAWSPDGRRLASVGQHDVPFDGPGLLKLWDSATGEEIGSWSQQMGPVAWSPDGGRLSSLTHLWPPGDTLLTVRDAPPAGDKPGGRAPKAPAQAADKTPAPLVVGEVRRFGGRFDGHAKEVTSVALSRDGQRALSGSFDKTVRVWDVLSQDTGKELRRLEGHQDVVWTVAFSPDGKRALSGGQDKTVRLWNVATGKQVHLLEGHGGIVSSVAFASDGRRALSAGWDKTVRLWDLDTGKEVRRLDLPAPVLSMALSPDGKRLFLGSNDGVLRLWDVGSGKELRHFTGPKGAIESVVWAPSGRTAAAACADKTVRLYDLESGKEVARFEGHTAKVDCVAFSPDGSRILSSGEDRSIRLWRVADGHELACFELGFAKVRSVVFSADGRRALSGSYDRTLSLLALPK